jgi:hypothetical protein
MARPYRWFWYLVVALVLVTWFATPGQARRVRGTFSTAPAQCANRENGPSNPINDCSGAAWINGNLNSNKSLYRGGDFVPFRTPIGGVVAGHTYSLRIAYDALVGGLHAYDYLGTYDASAAPGQQIVPCSGMPPTAGTHACGNNPSTVAVPIDTATTFPPGAGQAPGNFSLWGGALVGAAYVNPSPINVNTTGTIGRQIDVTFTAAGGTVVLGWGGHIASQLDWGVGNTFVGTGTGSPFHMSLKQIQESGQAPETIGGQDLSIQATVIAPPPSPFTTQVTPSSVTIGQRVIDTATLGGSGSAPVTGEVRFFVCGPSGAPPDCSQGGTEVLPQLVVLRMSRVGLNPDGTASIAFTPTEPGHYCFRAEYTPSPTAPYSPAAHTNTTTECFVATLPPPRLTITKLCVPANDPGHFNLLVGGAPLGGAAGTNVPCGGTTGPIQVNPGTYTVSESAGTGTNLGDYTSTIGGDCAPNGSITLALGDTATCTITNLRHPPPPPATLTLHKVCNPANDPGQFEIHVTGLLLRGRSVATLGCGESIGPVQVAPGSYTLSEAGVPPTDLADYTTVISGDCAANGSITLTAGQSASCTFTNTRITRLTVTKLCDPANDPGLFNLLVDGAPHGGAAGTNVPCGGATGPIEVTPGTHTVSESAGTGTSLGDYTSTISGDCAANGSITLAVGATATCTITNVHNAAPPPATLTVNKVCDPANDPGEFEIHVTGPNVAGRSVATVACGDSTGSIELAAGSYTVSETGVPPTDLTDYTTVISGDCAANGSVTLISGQSATCTITNTRIPPPPPRLTITKLCNPPDDPGRFDLLVNGDPLGGAAGTDVPCGGTTGSIQVPAGTHRVSESAGTDTSLGDYTSTINGDCAPDGSITLVAGETATCTITNTRRPAPPPATLTVHKVCNPANDPGQFEIHVTGPLVRGRSVASLACGESIGPVQVAPGSYVLSEAGVPPTSLADYTTIISGDCATNGSITLAAGDSASCTFTNTRIPPTTTLRVDKLCVPAGDDGHFKILIASVAGEPLHRAAVRCGGTTGPVHVAPGAYVVRERGADGTHVTDYDRYIGRDCQSDGTVTVAAGDEAICTILNVRHGTAPKPAGLTVTKICVPADDGGRFNLTINALTARDVPCGGKFGPVAVPPGQHRVGESAGTGTSLSDYTTTIGGACAADGSVTLGAGQLATCTITNTRAGEQTGTIEIQKQCSPAGTPGHFQIELDGQVFRSVACGESTGSVVIGTGDHQIGEVSVGNITGRFETTIGGDCSASGSFTVTPGRHVTCVITNTLVPIKPPLKPPHACYTLSVARRAVAVGRRVLVVARVHLGRRPIPGVRVYAVGLRVSVVRTTGRRGRALFLLSFHRRGVLRVSIRRAFDCPKPPPKKVGIVGAATPPVTG